MYALPHLLLFTNANIELHCGILTDALPIGNEIKYQRTKSKEQGAEAKSRSTVSDPDCWALYSSIDQTLWPHICHLRTVSVALRPRRINGLVLSFSRSLIVFRLLDQVLRNFSPRSQLLCAFNATLARQNNAGYWFVIILYAVPWHLCKWPDVTAF